jgi:hypothetical protein
MLLAPWKLVRHIHLWQNGAVTFAAKDTPLVLRGAV